MEACQESKRSPTSPEASPAEDHHIDLTEDLGQQLEDIISTYQAAEIPAEPEDTEEVTAVKEAETRKDQKMEKKMLKNLGVVCGFEKTNKKTVLVILSEVGLIQWSQQKSRLYWKWLVCDSRALTRVNASICNREGGKIVFPNAFYSLCHSAAKMIFHKMDQQSSWSPRKSSNNNLCISLFKTGFTAMIDF